MNLILLGAPGAGKGTQAELLSARLGYPAISTGNMLREAMRNGTEIGQKVKCYMDAGLLVPDDVVIDIVRERVARPDCRDGFILDGVPRTLNQAQRLIGMGLRVDHVISLEIDDSVIVSRMAGRRVCEHCGASYHVVANPPKTEGTCDGCGSRLIIRKDDAADTVLRRLEVYHQATEALKTYYESLGLLRCVEGNAPIGEAFHAILKAVGVEV